LQQFASLSSVALGRIDASGLVQVVAGLHDGWFSSSWYVLPSSHGSHVWSVVGVVWAAIRLPFLQAVRSWQLGWLGASWNVWFVQATQSLSFVADPLWRMYWPGVQVVIGLQLRWPRVSWYWPNEHPVHTASFSAVASVLLAVPGSHTVTPLQIRSDVGVAA